MKLRKSMLITGMLFSSIAYGYESSDYVNIAVVRPTASNTLYFDVSSANAMCGTNVFSLDLSKPGTKEMYATLLTAAMSGKKVKLETWGPCNSNGGGWGTEVQGIYVQF